MRGLLLLQNEAPEDLKRPSQFVHNSWQWARRDLDKYSFESPDGVNYTR